MPAFFLNRMKMLGPAELAKRAIGQYVTKGIKMEVPHGLPAELTSSKAGVFVTISKNQKLRGCIGTFMPTKDSVAEEIITNAISTCSQDPRFPPIQASELEGLEIEVSLLGEPRPISDLEKHDPRQEGVIVCAQDGRKGLLLPNLPGIDTAEKQIAIAAKKAGIDHAHERLQFYSFSTKVFRQ